MESAEEIKSSLSVRTVADVEVGAVATPSSPPATELDRMNFQKLLLQMNGVSLTSKGEASGNNSRSIPKQSDKAPDRETESGSTVSSDHDKQKKKKKSRGKKSNKPSPTDSPLKLTTDKGENVPLNKKEQHTTVAQNITQTVKASAGSTSSKVLSDQPNVAKSSQNLKISHHGHNQIDSSKVVSQGQPKQQEPTRQNFSKEIPPKGSKDPACLLQDTEKESESLEIFKKQPFMLLRAAINLIKPKKKISAVKDLNLFFCIPCDREFSDMDKHFEKAKEGHVIRWKCEMRHRTIDLLPDLSLRHISLLDDLVMTTVEKYKTPQENLKIAHSIWQTLDTLAKTKFKECSVRWFGSHVNGIALSDNKLLNMDLLVTNKEEAASTFLNFIAAVEQIFSKVDRVVATNFAHANIYHEGMIVQLSLNNNGAFNTAKLIRDYISIDKRVQPLCIFFRYWGQICGVDQGENGSWQGHAFPIMVIHFLQQRQVLPVLHDMLDNPDGAPEVYLDPKELQGRWFGRNKDSVGNLLFKMFRYYAIEHDVEKHVVSITQFQPYLRQATKWNAKRIAVIDPFQPKHNISRYISANMYDYVHFCLVTTTCSLGIPQSEAGPLFGYIGPRPEPSSFEQTPSILKEYLSVSDKIYELILRLDNSYEVADLRNDNEENVLKVREELNNSRVYQELYFNLRVVPSAPDSLVPSAPSKNAYLHWWVTPYQANTLSAHFLPSAQRLTLTKEMCVDNELPPVVCTSCHRSGHLREKCPEEIIPDMSPMSPPSKDLVAHLDHLCLEIFKTRCAEDSGLRDRAEIRDDLLMWLRQFYRDIDLHLFGSSLNGFGGKSSDIDMCLTFQSNGTGEGLNFPALVEEIQHALKGHKSVYQLVAITTAKVPIVKFAYGRNRIQVDISLYNRLGIMNTQLLHAYSIIDPRVRPLVYMTKNLAKTTGIGDASRGSLSSYAYSLMSLYFLQQVSPPVIPVLQELSDPDVGVKVETVDGANVYFYRNQDKLDDVWPHRNENKSSLGELWLQLLEFYSSKDFHSSQRVVCIRKKDPLYKFDKLWTSTNICIEDPFDLNHNLGSGLSKRMNIFIVKTFQKAIKHFSSFPKRDGMPLEKYYFNENALSVGKPPSDRGCHFCRSIGHVQNDCPKRLMMYQRGQQRPNGRDGRDNRENRDNRGQRGINQRQNHTFENFNRGGIHEKVWVDGCYDLFHYGHSNGLRQANLFGKKLIVGVHSNEAIQNNKGLPVMKDEERYEMVRSCRWVHEVVKSSPFVTDMKIVRSHGACLVMHANDQVLSSEGYDCYQEAKSEGMYREFERTLGISTTELVGRMLLRRNNAKVTVNNYVEYQENLAKEFIACMDKSPKINVIMIDGTFDLFHAGHVNTLKKAKELGGYLIIGLYSDESSKKLHGEYPVMTFLERKLVLLSCRYADEVIEIHPEITPNIIKELDIKIIAHGENKSSEFYSGISDLVKVIKISHSFSYLTNKVIIKRILENYKKYEERNINRLAI